MKKKRVKNRNPIAGALRTPVFKKRVVRNQKLYSRKGKAVRRNSDQDGFFLFFLQMIYTARMKKCSIYIDGNNLYRSAKGLGFEIDYKKFRGWLRQKYDAQSIYLFIGLVPSRTKFYEHLQECGFILVFKQTVTIGGVIKGNCDAELVLKVTSDFYTKSFDSCILVTGDGDFGCLVEFLKENSALHSVLAPDEKKCSILIKNKNIEVTFLNNLYHKFSS